MTATQVAADRAAAVPARFPWAPILVLGVAGFLGLTVELSPAGLLGDIASDFDATPAAVGTLTTFFALGNAILVLPLTALALRFSRRVALVSIMVVFVLSNLLVALAPSIPVADVGRFVGGGSWAVFSAMVPAVAARIAGRQYAARAISLVLTANTLGIAFGAPLASLVGDSVGWRYTFIGAAGIALVAAILLVPTIPHIPAAGRGHVSLLQTARISGVLRVCIGWALLMLGHFVVLTYLDAYLDALGLPPFVTSISLFLIGITGVAGIAGIGPIANRSVLVALIVGPVLVAVGFAVLYLGGAVLPSVLIGIAIWGVGFSATIVIYQRAILIVGHRAPETAMSIGVLLAQVGFAAGSTVGGFVTSTIGVRFTPAVALVFVLGTLAIAATLKRPLRNAQQDSQSEAG